MYLLSILAKTNLIVFNIFTLGTLNKQQILSASKGTEYMTLYIGDLDLIILKNVLYPLIYFNIRKVLR